MNQQQYNREYYKNNRARLLRRRRKYYRLNQPKLLAYQKSHRRNNASRIRAYDRRRQFEKKGKAKGWTLEDVWRAWKKQKGCCAICKKKLKKGRAGFCRDHCHATGRRRDLLCWSCNVALGHFLDNPLLLERAAKYLRRHRSVK